MRKILCMIVAFVICSFSVLSCVHAEGTEDLHNQQQELQNEINNANEQLEDVQSELSENLQQVQKLDERIMNTEQELS